MQKAPHNHESKELGKCDVENRDGIKSYILSLKLIYLKKKREVLLFQL